jgi:hypothetical protein
MKSSLLLKVIVAALALSAPLIMATEVSKQVKSAPTTVEPAKPETIRTVPLPEIVPTPNNGPEPGTTPHYPDATPEQNDR